MKIGIICAGDLDQELDQGLSLGLGLLLHNWDKHDIIFGSYDTDKAFDALKKIIDTKDIVVILRMKNWFGNGSFICPKISKLDIRSCEMACKAADLIIFALPFQHVASMLAEIDSKYLAEKIVISALSPMIEKDGIYYYNPPDEGSAALAIKKMLPESAKLVTAFNNIAASKWIALNEVLDYTVAVCGDDAEAKKTVIKLVRETSQLYGLDAGPLAVSGIVESITPLAINIAQINGLKDLGVYIK